MAHRRRANICNVILNTEPPWARENRPLSDGGIKGPGDPACMGVSRRRTLSVGTCIHRSTWKKMARETE